MPADPHPAPSAAEVPLTDDEVRRGLELVAVANDRPTDPAAYEPWNQWKFAHAWALLIEVAAVRASPPAELSPVGLDWKHQISVDLVRRMVADGRASGMEKRLLAIIDRLASPPGPQREGLTEGEREFIEDFRLYTPVTPGSVFVSHTKYAEACNRLLAIIDRLAPPPATPPEDEA